MTKIIVFKLGTILGEIGSFHHENMWMLIYSLKACFYGDLRKIIIELPTPITPCYALNF